MLKDEIMASLDMLSLNCLKGMGLLHSLRISFRREMLSEVMYPLDPISNAIRLTSYPESLISETKAAYLLHLRE